MSAMSELDLMLKEYEGARAAMVSTAGTTILGHMQAAENVIRAADVLACGLRSMLTANANDQHPIADAPVDGCDCSWCRAARSRAAVAQLEYDRNR